MLVNKEQKTFNVISSYEKEVVYSQVISRIINKNYVRIGVP